MTELIEEELEVRCEQCNKKINRNGKISFVFYNVHDPPLTCHKRCVRSNPDIKALAIRNCTWENRPERYIDLNNKQKDISSEAVLLNMRANHQYGRRYGMWRLRRRSRRRRRW